MNEIKIKSGLDIGNGYVKGEILQNEFFRNGESISVPSVVSSFSNPNSILAESSDAIRSTISNLYNKMDVSFSSAVISNTGRFLVGAKAIAEGDMNTTFDVNTHQSKAQQELSFILALATLGATALKAYFDKNNQLPGEIVKAEVDVVLALPITEFQREKELYEKGFINNTHIVTFHNFKNLVRVELSFKHVIVVSEGACGQFALSHDVSLLENSYKNTDEPNENIAAEKNVIGIDVGEGTVNFAVMRDESFSPTASKTLINGFGTVLERVVDNSTEVAQHNITTRDGLGDFLVQGLHSGAKNRYNLIKSIVLKESVPFVNSIVKRLNKILASGNTGLFTTVIYVYGGGSIFIKDLLYPLLADNIEDNDLKIVYINEKYARLVNLRGLSMIASANFNDNLSEND